METDKNEFIYALMQMKGWGPKRIYEYCNTHCFDLDQCYEFLPFVFSDYELRAFDFCLKESHRIIENEKNNGVGAISLLDDSFPKCLYENNDGCVFLFYKGDVSLLKGKNITVIGTRCPTDDFINKGKQLCEILISKNYTLVSGLAIGCDTIAHKTACSNGGKTIAVLPSCIEKIQPKTNTILANKIVKTGGLLISEYSSEDSMTQYNYPKRDRIQSLLSECLIVIQASENSGTMIAVRKTLKDNKNVFALAGNSLKLISKYIQPKEAEKLLLTI